MPMAASAAVAELSKWFEETAETGAVYSIPGYTLNYMKTDDQTTYAVLPDSGAL